MCIRDRNNLIRFGTQRHVCHNLVERLVRVGEERNLLTGHQRIVQIDTGNTLSLIHICVPRYNDKYLS